MFDASHPVMIKPQLRVQEIELAENRAILIAAEV